MSAMSPVPANHPLMTAWNTYKASDDFEKTKRWAAIEAYTEGSLWAAFAAGFGAQPTQSAEAWPPRCARGNGRKGRCVEIAIREVETTMQPIGRALTAYWTPVCAHHLTTAGSHARTRPLQPEGE
jgi:hypothetical protein